MNSIHRPPLLVLLALLAGGCAGVRHTSIPVDLPLLIDPKAATSNTSLAATVGTNNVRIRQTNEKRDLAVTGFRYYRPAPYLLVYANAKGSLSWEIHQLPDPTTKQLAQPYNYIATLKAKLDLDERGSLGSITESADSAALPKEIFGAIKELAPLIAKGLMNATSDDAGATNDFHHFPPPQLYKITIADGDVRLVGGAGGTSVLYATPTPK